MRASLRRLRAALSHPGPGYDTRPDPLPSRHDAVEAWLIAQQDALIDDYGYPSPEWFVVDALLGQYQHDADAGLPLAGLEPVGGTR